jgi:segregation and condensation protein B
MASRMTHFGVATRRPYTRFPGNHRLPPALQPAEKGREPLGELARDAALARVEAALFLADEPLTPRKLAIAAEINDAGEARRLIQRLKDYYDKDETAFQIEDIAGGWQLRTRTKYYPWLVRLRHTNPDPKLSAAARETLAIVAYRQPVMRADIEAIRGVQCGELLRLLMEKGLLRIAGRHESLGRPVLYATTKKFLQMFGLNSLKDLPEVEQLRPPASNEGA